MKVEIGRVAEQANGAALVYYGDTVVLVTATASEKPRDGIDFFPLSIDYEGKTLFSRKNPRRIYKKRRKTKRKAILTSRCIDRPPRPPFP